MAWVEAQLNNEHIFPTELGKPFPTTFFDIVRTIFKRLFRVYAHTYHSHFEKVVSLGAEAHLNTCFKRFIYFVDEFGLIDLKEQEPLKELICTFFGTVNPWTSVRVTAIEEESAADAKVAVIEEESAADTKITAIAVEKEEEEAKEDAYLRTEQLEESVGASTFEIGDKETAQDALEAFYGVYRVASSQPREEQPVARMKPQLAEEDKFFFNSEFQRLVDLSDTPAEAPTHDKYQQLAQLVADFRVLAVSYAQTIVMEHLLPGSARTINVERIGGRAGGTKYVVRGILFKMCADVEQRPGAFLYGGSRARYDYAAKAAANELRGTSHYFSVLKDHNVRVPFQMMLDYHGFRLLAMPLLPLQQLVYGSANAAVEVMNQDDELAAAMQVVATRYHLGRHRVGSGTNEQELYSAVDVEGHIGTDGLRYVLDLGRWSPCEHPEVLEHLDVDCGSVFFRLMRPEFLLKLSEASEQEEKRKQEAALVVAKENKSAGTDSTVHTGQTSSRPMPTAGNAVTTSEAPASTGGEEGMVVAWIAAVTEEAVSDIFPGLQTGIVLCKLANCIQPGSVKKINRFKQAFMHRENICAFITFCDTLGIQRHHLFECADLYEQRNLKQVLRCLVHVGDAAQARGFKGPSMRSGGSDVGDAVEKAPATEEERKLKAEEKGIEMAAGEAKKSHQEKGKPQDYRTIRPLSPDAMTTFGLHDAETHNRNVLLATQELMHTVRALAKDLLNLKRRLGVHGMGTTQFQGTRDFSFKPPVDFFRLHEVFHYHGVSMRHLGIVRSLVLQLGDSPGYRKQKKDVTTVARYLLLEMVVRSLKELLRHRLRRLVEDHAKESSWVSASESRMLVASFLNLLTGSASESFTGPFWKEHVPAAVYLKFGEQALVQVDTSTLQKEMESYVPDIVPKVLTAVGVQLAGELGSAAFTGRHIFVDGDIRLETRVKMMSYLAYAVGMAHKYKFCALMGMDPNVFDFSKLRGGDDRSRSLVYMLQRGLESFRQAGTGRKCVSECEYMQAMIDTLAAGPATVKVKGGGGGGVSRWKRKIKPMRAQGHGGGGGGDALDALGVIAEELPGDEDVWIVAEGQAIAKRACSFKPGQLIVTTQGDSDSEALTLDLRQCRFVTGRTYTPLWHGLQFPFSVVPEAHCFSVASASQKESKPIHVGFLCEDPSVALSWTVFLKQECTGHFSETAS